MRAIAVSGSARSAIRTLGERRSGGDLTAERKGCPEVTQLRHRSRSSVPNMKGYNPPIQAPTKFDG